MKERRIQRFTGFLLNPGHDFDPAFLQTGHRCTGVFRVGIDPADHHTFEFPFNDRLAAGGRTPEGGTGLQGHIDRGSFCLCRIP